MCVYVYVCGCKLKQVLLIRDDDFKKCLNNFRFYSILGRLKVNLATLVEGDPKAPFSIAPLNRGVRESATVFPGLLHFTLDPHLKVLSARQGGIKYHFLSL